MVNTRHCLGSVGLLILTVAATAMGAKPVKPKVAILPSPAHRMLGCGTQNFHTGGTELATLPSWGASAGVCLNGHYTAPSVSSGTDVTITVTPATTEQYSANSETVHVDTAYPSALATLSLSNRATVGTYSDSLAEDGSRTHAIYMLTSGTKPIYATHIDAGGQFSTPVLVPVKTGYPTNFHGPSIAVGSPSAVGQPNRVYVTYSTPPPAQAPGGYIWLAWSTDGGVTWPASNLGIVASMQPPSSAMSNTTPRIRVLSDGEIVIEALPWAGGGVTLYSLNELNLGQLSGTAPPAGSVGSTTVGGTNPVGDTTRIAIIPRGATFPPATAVTRCVSWISGSNGLGTVYYSCGNRSGMGSATSATTGATISADASPVIALSPDAHHVVVGWVQGVQAQSSGSTTFQVKTINLLTNATAIVTLPSVNRLTAAPAGATTNYEPPYNPDIRYDAHGTLWATYATYSKRFVIFNSCDNGTTWSGPFILVPPPAVPGGTQPQDESRPVLGADGLFPVFGTFPTSTNGGNLGLRWLGP